MLEKFLSHSSPYLYDKKRYLFTFLLLSVIIYNQFILLYIDARYTSFLLNSLNFIYLLIVIEYQRFTQHFSSVYWGIVTKDVILCHYLLFILQIWCVPDITIEFTSLKKKKKRIHKPKGHNQGIVIRMNKQKSIARIPTCVIGRLPPS